MQNEENTLFIIESQEAIAKAIHFLENSDAWQKIEVFDAGMIYIRGDFAKYSWVNVDSIGWRFEDDESLMIDGDFADIVKSVHPVGTLGGNITKFLYQWIAGDFDVTAREHVEALREAVKSPSTSEEIARVDAWQERWFEELTTSNSPETI